MKSIYSKYGLQLFTFIRNLAYNAFKEEVDKLPFNSPWDEFCLGYAEVLKHAIKEYNMDLLEICKIAHTNSGYGLKNAGIKTIHGLYNFMQDQYGITVSQYTPDELHKLLNEYKKNPTKKQHVKVKVKQTYHVSFNVTVTELSQDKGDISALFEKRIKNSINKFCGTKNNIEIKEIQ